MNKKYTYCTVITNDDYTPCVIRQKQRMEYLQCQYPFIVIVTDNTPQKTIKELEKHNIEYKIVPLLSFNSNDDRLKETINKFYALTLIEYDKVLFIEADSIIINNLDNLFNQCNFKSCQHFILYDRHYKDEMWVFGGFFFCKPNITFFNNLLILNENMKGYFEHDEAFLNKFFFQDISLDLPAYFGNILHFSGLYKVWNLNYSFYNFLFNTMPAIDFNYLLDDYQNVILFEEILIGHIDFWGKTLILQEKINYKE